MRAAFFNTHEITQVGLLFIPGSDEVGFQWGGSLFHDILHFDVDLLSDQDQEYGY